MCIAFLARWPGKLPTDASAKRFILSATVGEPEIHQVRDMISKPSHGYLGLPT